MNNNTKCEITKSTLPHMGKDEIKIAVYYDKTGYLSEFTLNAEMMSIQGVDDIVASIVKKLYNQCKKDSD